jgi:hypothetical protein
MKIHFFSHFLVVAWPIFFQISKTNIFISNFKNDFFFKFFMVPYDFS